MSEKILNMIPPLYFIITILVYGYAFHDIEYEDNGMLIEKKITGALCASALWPFYLSTKIWSEE